VAEIDMQSGRTARIISRVDTLLDSLAEFQATGHEVPAQQALALLTLSKAEAAGVDARAANRRVATILKVIRQFVDNRKAT
jgi:hypothetical protein